MRTFRSGGIVPALLLIVSACSSSAPAVDVPPPPPPPSGPAYEALYVSPDGVSVHDFATDQVTRASTESGSVSVIAYDRDGERVAFTLTSADSVGLYTASLSGGTLGYPVGGTLDDALDYPVGGTLDDALDYPVGGTLDNRLSHVHTAAAPTTFTAVWGPEGLAYGFYRPTRRDSRPAMGAGDIRTFDGSTSVRVGCSASRAVLSWMDDGNLLVRNTDNLYVVSRDECDTRATVDARRMVGLTVSPDAGNMAFVHRELQYNRTTRTYVPDSTFRMTTLSGDNPRSVVSFRYSPRRFAWRPDGQELAFDVIVPDTDGVRAISIYDVATGQTAYLHAPGPGAVSEFEPIWSPSGDAILYRRGAALAVRQFATPFPTAIEDTDGAEPLGWVGNGAIIMRLDNGIVRVAELGGSAFDLPAGVHPVAAWPSK